jgi:tetratricopeptide (TPR) repeat protein
MRGRGPALVALVCLATGLAFLPALTAGWVNWDDPATFLSNPHYRGLGLEQLRWMWGSFWMGHYTPSSWMSLGLDYLLWGMDPRGYHASNLLLHLLGTGLFVLVIRALLERVAQAEARWIWLAAAAGALFYGLHPLRVESVAWITERRDVLAMVFFQATLLAWLKAQGSPRRGWWTAAALLLHALSLSAKAHAITLPALLLILDVWPLKRAQLEPRVLAKLVIEKIPFAVLAAAGAWMAIRAQDHAGALQGVDELSFGSRAAVVAHSLSFYPGKTLLPVGLSPLYELDQGSLSPLPYLAVVVAITAGLALLWRRFPAGLVAWLCYGVLLSPVSGLTQSGPQAVADRYATYSCLPFAVLFAGAALLGLRWWARPEARRRGALLLVGLSLWLAVLGVATWRQTTIWQSSVSLWQAAARQSPDNEIVLHQLGKAWAEVGDLSRAAAAYEAALSVAPPRAETLLELGTVLARQSGTVEPGAGAALLRRSIALWSQIEPHEDPYAQAQRGIGLAWDQLGQPEPAMQAYARAVAAAPDLLAAYEPLAASLERLGQPERAAEVRAEIARRTAQQQGRVVAPHR